MSRLSDNPTASADAARVPQGPEFSPQQRKILLALARESILSEFAGKPLTDVESSFAGPSSGAASSKAWLLEPRGIFTTIYLRGELRGCVGYPTAIRPLWRSVAETARAAAFDDSRFWPVTVEEARDLKISLSVLSPLFPIEAEQVEVGRHGLMISDGMRRGLLLPQVPVEHDWDRETFLEQTCRKAALPIDAWRKSATIEAFTAEVFGDED
jgi:AmmeMemoRadiSam system protein A